MQEHSFMIKLCVVNLPLVSFLLVFDERDELSLSIYGEVCVWVVYMFIYICVCVFV